MKEGTRVNYAIPLASWFRVTHTGSLIQVVWRLNFGQSISPIEGLYTLAKILYVFEEIAGYCTNESRYVETSLEPEIAKGTCTAGNL